MVVSCGLCFVTLTVLSSLCMHSMCLVVDARPLLIGASIGGGILLIVSVILLMIALWMVRRKNTDNSPGKDGECFK